MSSDPVRVSHAAPSYGDEADAQPVPPGYKRTELGVIPQDWEVKGLGLLGEVLIGLTYKPSDIREHGILVLRSSNIQNDALAFHDNVFVNVDIPERIRVRSGDVLICVRNGSRDLIGKSTLLDERVVGMTFGAFMAVFRSPIGKAVSYLFQSEILKRQINEHLGATINQITNKSLNSFMVPIPTMVAEQCAIAEALSDVDGLLGALDALISKKRAIKQAAMQQLLTGRTRLPGFSGGWKTKRIGELGVTFGGLAGKTKADFGIGDARYVTFLNVLENVVIDPTAHAAVRVLPGEAQNPVRIGDLLFNGTSETPGDLAMAAVVGNDEQGLYLNSFCFGLRLRADSRCLPLFLAYYFRGIPGRRIMYALAQGATRHNMSKSQFAALELLLPNPDEQRAIAAVLSDMDAEIAALEARRDKTRAIKQGMMQQLLTGRIRLVKPEPAPIDT